MSTSVMSKRNKIALLIIVFLLARPSVVWAAPTIDGLLNTVNGNLEVLFLLSIITLLPSILIMMTSFTRIIIVLSFLRNALGLQQSPPNQVLVGIALFLTMFIMSPVLSTIQAEAYVPYEAGEISGTEAIGRMEAPIKEFMLRQTKPEELDLFLSLSDTELPEDRMTLKMSVVIPAFVVSELKQAFIMGFLIYLPFIVIDMVVASTLMSMGMIMLPPAMISLPFKLLLFVLIDGWSLLVDTLVRSFH